MPSPDRTLEAWELDPHAFRAASCMKYDRVARPFGNAASSKEIVMAQVKDPVCGMTIDSATAAGKSTHQGTTYFFCSAACKQRFDAEPSKFLGGPKAGGAERAPRH